MTATVEMKSAAGERVLTAGKTASITNNHLKGLPMKPTLLKPGMRVLIEQKYISGETYHGTFIERVPRHYSRAAYSIIRVDEFAGLNGAKDLGDTQYSDYDVSRRVSLQEKAK